MFDRLDRYLEIFSTTVMMITMSLATLVAFINVVLRYGFNMSLSWAGEMTSYLFIWSALFGAAYGFKIGMHLGVTIVIHKLKPKVAKVVLTFSLLIILGYLLALIVWGYNFCVFNYELEQSSVDMGIPFWIIYGCVPITMGIAAYQVILKIVKLLKVPGDEFSYDMVMKEH
ncbi:2,3-diketo-L-gulonate TRAP transporter permease [Desulfuromonas versatilis]|uniref:2,3-diketo-L-gulonate TRAP transporter permease n=1 Tax=Desulfuromonas versatilis TaxID=2802975 RepID=A0ABM8HN68_9BACT|nr:TRAP transporter small permease [Desulfuromonas versatilis]BCR04123.1 2,3-diketo-L-gulonate TRAP transporter permease [Desulfuromonas versatilis]